MKRDRRTAIDNISKNLEISSFHEKIKYSSIPAHHFRTYAQQIFEKFRLKPPEVGPSVERFV